MANYLPQGIDCKVYRTYDYMYALQIGGLTTGAAVYGTLESFGRLLYRMGESVYLYTDIDMRAGGMTVDPASIAHELFTAMLTAHGDKRGRKPSCGVYLVDANTGEIVQHFRFGK